MTCLLAVAYAKRCIGFGWARAFCCNLAGDGEPALSKYNHPLVT